MMALAGSASRRYPAGSAVRIAPVSGRHRPDAGIQAALVPGSFVSVDYLLADAVIDQGHRGLVGAFGPGFVTGLDGLDDPLDEGAHF